MGTSTSIEQNYFRLITDESIIGNIIDHSLLHNKYFLAIHTCIHTDLDTNPTLNLMAASAEQLNNTKFKIEHFTYRNNIVKAIMFGHLEKTNFTGITVCIHTTTHLYISVAVKYIRNYKIDYNDIV